MIIGKEGVQFNVFYMIKLLHLIISALLCGKIKVAKLYSINKIER